ERTEVGDGDLLSVRKCVLDRRHHDVDVAGGPYLRNVGLRGEGFGEIGLVHAASLGPRPVRPREDVGFVFTILVIIGEVWPRASPTLIEFTRTPDPDCRLGRVTVHGSGRRKYQRGFCVATG